MKITAPYSVQKNVTTVDLSTICVYTHTIIDWFTSSATEQQNKDSENTIVYSYFYYRATHRTTYQVSSSTDTTILQ